MPEVATSCRESSPKRESPRHQGYEGIPLCALVPFVVKALESACCRGVDCAATHRFPPKAPPAGATVTEKEECCFRPRLYPESKALPGFLGWRAEVQRAPVHRTAPTPAMMK